MENSKGDIIVKDEWVVVGLDPRDIIKGFPFPILCLKNLVDTSDFKQERKAQTFIREPQRDFGYDPTNNEVMWWFNSSLVLILTYVLFYVLAMKQR